MHDCGEQIMGETGEGSVENSFFALLMVASRPAHVLAGKTGATSTRAAEDVSVTASILRWAFVGALFRT